jgi:hypothetical protein
MKPNQLFTLMAILCLSTATVQKVNAQAQAGKLTQAEIHQTIVNLDSSMFVAFNTCNVQQFKTYFTDDLEFYHDKGGPTFSMQKFVADFEKGLCNPNKQWKSRRQVVPGSLKVYPMNNYGAILVGEHTFYETELATGKEYRRSTAKFTHLFQEQNGVWKIVRVLSYDHQMPK